MADTPTNIVFALQSGIAEYLNSELGNYGIEFYAENRRDIEYQIKNALARQGIACIVTTPDLNYQGHDHEFYTYDADVELQIAENPTVNRARMEKGGLEWGTGLDVAVTATDLLGGPESEFFSRFVPKTITQANEGQALVVTRARLSTHIWRKILDRETWDVVSDERTELNGAYVLTSEVEGVKKYTSIGHDSYFTISPQTGGWIFSFCIPDEVELIHGIIGDLPSTITVSSSEGFTVTATRRDDANLN